MLLTITTTHSPATDLGYLLYKHPQKIQSVELAVGKAHIFYPEATEERCTVALLLDIDPIELIRGKANDSFALSHYVNDRPYVTSSFMSVALATAFSTAMNGTCRDKPELVDVKLPLEVTLAVASVRGGETLIRRLFESLGYTLELENYPLDATVPEWGDSKYFHLKLQHTLRLKDLLSHLYVLMPVLDNDKHYFVNKQEIEKLMDKGKDWLSAHPEKELITKRYLKNIHHLTRQAFEVLMSEELPDEEEEMEEESEVVKVVKQKHVSLHYQRLQTVFEKLVASNSKRVLDLGCGEGKLLQLLLRENQFEEILGMDVSHRSLEIAAERLRFDRLPAHVRQRISLIQGSLTYKDKRLQGFDAAALVEVIEHLDLNRLQALEQSVFGFARPKLVLLTTPNAEYNQKYETLIEGKFRHEDHRFEWTRTEFETWTQHITDVFGYDAELFTVGEVDEQVGASSQGVVFKRKV
ncbi:3' terminal RNA ribose 2'-O-methyltransferase Hen1 [Cytophagaceae bacterium YF14B1]|uniref:Small RNA 2'-O-methyltransferase n=1 Tax=Xanthocytophaga flava TaxID=3048013 RepID=A0AAE3QXZ4_9BACT|nr:3' terminal RNA ribose 2'-O-methyltransferase Hen1 [Xanthocytophaga flavus]MDJ1485518.1 3' terminal RNA ribose 2'-O-methyltransferase Hen1 [Xanthocytophaga flavus]